MLSYWWACATFWFFYLPPINWPQRMMIRFCGTFLFRLHLGQTLKQLLIFSTSGNKWCLNHIPNANSNLCRTSANFFPIKWMPIKGTSSHMSCEQMTSDQIDSCHSDLSLGIEKVSTCLSIWSKVVIWEWSFVVHFFVGVKFSTFELNANIEILNSTFSVKCLFNFHQHRWWCKCNWLLSCSQSR